MSRTSSFLAVACLAAGTLLGYAGASGKLDLAYWARADQPTAPAKRDGCCDADNGTLLALAKHNEEVAEKSEKSGKKPNILILWGDDIGWWNVSAYNHGSDGLQDTQHRSSRQGRRACSPIGTASKAAPPAVRASSPASPASAPACSRSVCPAPRKVCRRATSPSLNCSRPRATSRVSSARITSEISIRAPAHRVHGFDEFFGSLYHLNAEEEFGES